MPERGERKGWDEETTICLNRRQSYVCYGLHKPDIAFVVGAVSRYMSNPRREHWATMKWILRCLKSTSQVCLRYGVGKPMLKGFTDSNMSGDVESSRSTSGYVLTYARGAVLWQSWLQKSVALSTIEAEYMAAVDANKELIWMRNFLSELGMKQRDFLLHCDSLSAIHLAKNVAYHSQTKHIQRRYHWLREKVEEGEFTLLKIHTDENGSNMMTKSLPMDRLRVCRQRTELTYSLALEWRGSLLGICPSSGQSWLIEPTRAENWRQGGADCSEVADSRRVDNRESAIKLLIIIIVNSNSNDMYPWLHL